MFLNANLYTWSYRVAEWSWQEELAQEVAAAIMDTSGGEASPISETAAEIGGLAAGSVLGALMLAPFEPELDVDVVVEKPASDADDGGDAQRPDPASPLALPAEPAAAPVDAPRGHWVLKGYRTLIAYSVHPDQNKMDLAFLANEQSGAEIDNKARARRPLAAGAGPHPWHDRGPEPE